MSTRCLVRAKLNDVILAKLKLAVSGQYCVWDAGLPSFGVRVSTHSKSFVLKKANRYHVLGRYPAVSLKQARDEAKRRIALKYFPQPGISVQAAIELFLEAKKHSQRPTSHYLYSRALTYFPAGKPINQVTFTTYNQSSGECRRRTPTSPMPSSVRSSTGVLATSISTRTRCKGNSGRTRPEAGIASSPTTKSASSGIRVTITTHSVCWFAFFS